MRSSRLSTEGSLAAAADWEGGSCGCDDDCASSPLGVNEKRSSSSQREPINCLLKPKQTYSIACSCLAVGKPREFQPLSLVRRGFLSKRGLWRSTIRMETLRMSDRAGG